MFDASLSYYPDGAEDARRGKPYSPPRGSFTDGLSRASYRAGYIVQRVRDGKQTLPAMIGGAGGRTYWLVDLDPKPVFQVSADMTAPEGKAGYRDLGALLKLKGDRWAEFRAL